MSALAISELSADTGISIAALQQEYMDALERKRLNAPEAKLKDPDWVAPDNWPKTQGSAA